jgi:hypothetical protein
VVEGVVAVHAGTLPCAVYKQKELSAIVLILLLLTKFQHRREETGVVPRRIRRERA